MKLLSEAEESEVVYLVRFVQGNLKIGAAEASMQSSLVKALFDCRFGGAKMREEVYQEKLDCFEKKVKQAYCEYPDYQKMVGCLLEMGSIEEFKEEMKITVGVPCKPMLAKPTKEIQIIFKRFENMKFTCEYKYDGLRGQIHYNKNKCKVTY